MAKAKTMETAADAVEAVEAALEKGADKFKESFEKASKGFEKFAAFQKESMEAWMEAAGLMGKGAEKLQAELSAYMKSSTESLTAASKAIFGAKTVQEAFDLQSSFAKSSFEGYVAEMKKVSELVSSTTKSALEPIQVKTKEFMEMLKPKAA